MSRSYRKPYSSVTGAKSAHYDKMFASRGVRRKQNQVLRQTKDWDEFLIPHRFECDHNDVWSWGRDGKQKLRTLRHNDFNPYYCSSWRTEEQSRNHHVESLERHMKWLRELTRK